MRKLSAIIEIIDILSGLSQDSYEKFKIWQQCIFADNPECLKLLNEILSIADDYRPKLIEQKGQQINDCN